MENSILLSIKKIVGSGEDNDDFDDDIITHINTVLSTLQQLGVGPSNGFSIEDATATWTDYLGNDHAYINMVKSYMAAKVRQLFDPPVQSAVADALQRNIDQFEWRINVAAENHQREVSEG